MKGKLAALVVVTCMALAANSAFAKEGDNSIEATINFGTESFDGLNEQVGGTIGVGYEFRNNLQGRVDVSYFRSGEEIAGADIRGTRVPFDFSVRCLHPLTGIDKNLTAFAQAGVEVSFDKASGLNREVNLGAVAGAGAEYKLTPKVGALVNVQYHLVDGSYLSAGIGAAYHF